jgi:acyl-CoA thioesterase I
MMRRWPVLLAVMWLAGCARDVPHAMRDGPIIAFGDSLVYGTGSSGGGFVKMMEKRLGRPIVNLGVPGNTTADGIKRLNAVIRQHPAVVILLLGGNDYLQQVPRDEVFANLARIIERLQADRITVLLVGVRGGLIRDNFAEYFEALADRYHTAYVPDVLEETLGVSGYMADQVHPNDAGYQVIADRVYPVLAEMVGSNP